MNDSDKGAMNELLVASDLMRQGWEVFRALSPAASCDMIIQRNGEVLRLEVKTGHRAYVGGKPYPYARVNVKQDGRWDVLAVVVGVTIIYVGFDEEVYLDGRMVKRRETGIIFLEDSAWEVPQP